MAHHRVVVAGAGIGGLAVAAGLQARGHEVSVFEAAPGLRTGGAAISLWPNGMAALTRLGLPAPSTGERITALRTSRWDATPLYDMDTAALGRRLGQPTVVVPRAELVSHLAHQLRDGTIRFGRPALDVSHDGPAATLRLADGTRIDADLVVGADGHRSVVRSFVHDTGPARSTGLVAWQGVQPTTRRAGADGDALYIQGPQGWFGLMPAGSGRLLWWFDLPRSLTAHVVPHDRADWIRAHFSAWRSPVPEVIAELDPSDIEPWEYTWHPVPPSLNRGTAVLLGDAAHAMPPSLSQGANQTLEDAWVLTDELTRRDQVLTAISGYQRRRRRRAAAVSRAARSRIALSGAPAWTDSVARHVPTSIWTRTYGGFLRVVSNSL